MDEETESGPVKLPTIAAYLMFVNAINSSKIYAHETDSQDYSCFQISLIEITFKRIYQAFHYYYFQTPCPLLSVVLSLPFQVIFLLPFSVRNLSVLPCHGRRCTVLGEYTEISEQEEGHSLGSKMPQCNLLFCLKLTAEDQSKRTSRVFQSEHD